jgi:hypothetical protein
MFFVAHFLRIAIRFTGTKDFDVRQLYLHNQGSKAWINSANVLTMFCHLLIILSRMGILLIPICNDNVLLLNFIH